MDIFEKAARKKMRFATSKGDLNSEQIWNLSLNELDVAARMVNSELKGVTEESFIKVEPDPRAAEIKLQLDVLKRVIEVKLQEKDDREKAAERGRIHIDQGCDCFLVQVRFRQMASNVIAYDPNAFIPMQVAFQ